MPRGRTELIGVKSEELRKIIKEKGYSIRQMTKLLDELAEEHSAPGFKTSPSFLSQIITGKRNLGPIKAKGLCLLLDATFEQVFFMKTDVVKLSFD